MREIKIVPNGITNLGTDAVVNAANSGLWAGAGVCGIIFDAAGVEKLQNACNKIGGCKVGSAVITPAFDLDAKYIIHAVGPQWRDGDSGEPKLLYGAYRRSLELAEENGCESIGFPLISTGIFRYPVDRAWHTALQAVKDFMDEKPECGLDVYFAVPNGEIRAKGKRELEMQM